MTSLERKYAMTLSKSGKRQRGGRRRRNRAAVTTGWGPTAEAALLTAAPLFPASVRKKLFYYAPAVSLTGSAGVLAQYVFSANGMYDPDVTGSGHQPMGFDTMMASYYQFTVLRSKITVRGCGNGAQAVNVSVSLAPSTTTAVIPDLVENGMVNMMILDGRGNTSSGTGPRIGEISLGCDVPLYFGRPRGRSVVNDSLLSGTVAANPTEQVYFFVNTWGFGGFSDNTAVELDVIIEYDAVFWERRKMSAQLISRLMQELTMEANPHDVEGPELVVVTSGRVGPEKPAERKDTSIIQVPRHVLQRMK